MKFKKVSQLLVITFAIGTATPAFGMQHLRTALNWGGRQANRGWQGARHHGGRFVGGARNLAYRAYQGTGLQDAARGFANGRANALRRNAQPVPVVQPAPNPPVIPVAPQQPNNNNQQQGGNLQQQLQQGRNNLNNNNQQQQAQNPNPQQPATNQNKKSMFTLRRCALGGGLFVIAAILTYYVWQTVQEQKNEKDEGLVLKKPVTPTRTARKVRRRA